MSKLIAFLSGKKTYIIAIATISFGVLGWALGIIPKEQAIEVILGGLGLGSLRASVNKTPEV